MIGLNVWFGSYQCDYVGVIEQTCGTLAFYANDPDDSTVPAALAIGTRASASHSRAGLFVTMKRMILASLATVLIVHVPAAAGARATLGFENNLRRAITTAGRPADRFSLTGRMSHYCVPGVSVAVVEECRVVETRGFGITRANGPAITSDTLLQAASISKSVTALGALRLVEEGRLSLDEDVRVRLKTWRLPDSPLLAQQDVTLRLLLSHSAGFNVGGFDGYRAGSPLPSVVQILNGEAPANNVAVRLQSVPGAQWSYSGGGYLIAQVLMTDATQRPFPQLMHDLVLAPAGMVDSTYVTPLPVNLEARAAAGHLETGEIVPGKWHVYPELGAASLWTTPRDVARFAIAIMQANRGIGGALISRAMAADMLTAQTAERGLGVIVQGQGRARSFSHGGTNEGYRAMMVAHPETCQGAVIMANGDNGRPLINEILRAIADVYEWPDPRASAQVVPTKLTSALATRYAGTYQSVQRPDAFFEIRTDGRGGLQLGWLRRRAATQWETLSAFSGGLFAADSGLIIKAPPDVEGPMPRLTYSVGFGQDYQATRVSPSAQEVPRR